MSAARRLISSGSSFEKQIGYSRAVVDGSWVFMSGTTGFNYATMSIADNVIEQTEQCFRNIAAALAEAGASLADVVRVRYILTRAADFEPIWPVMQKHLGTVTAGRDDDRCGPGRCPNADRDRGYRAASRVLTAW